MRNIFHLHFHTTINLQLLENHDGIVASEFEENIDDMSPEYGRFDYRL